MRIHDTLCLLICVVVGYVCAKELIHDDAYMKAGSGGGGGGTIGNRTQIIFATLGRHQSGAVPMDFNFEFIPPTNRSVGHTSEIDSNTSNKLCRGNVLGSYFVVPILSHNYSWFDTMNNLILHIKVDTTNASWKQTRSIDYNMYPIPALYDSIILSIDTTSCHFVVGHIIKTNFTMGNRLTQLRNTSSIQYTIDTQDIFVGNQTNNGYLLEIHRAFSNPVATIGAIFGISGIIFAVSYYALLICCAPCEGIGWCFVLIPMLVFEFLTSISIIHTLGQSVLGYGTLKFASFHASYIIGLVYSIINYNKRCNDLEENTKKTSFMYHIVRMDPIEVDNESILTDTVHRLYKKISRRSDVEELLILLYTIMIFALGVLGDMIVRVEIYTHVTYSLILLYLLVGCIRRDIFREKYDMSGWRYLMMYDGFRLRFYISTLGSLTFYICTFNMGNNVLWKFCMHTIVIFILLVPVVHLPKLNALTRTCMTWQYRRCFCCKKPMASLLTGEFETVDGFINEVLSREFFEYAYQHECAWVVALMSECLMYSEKWTSTKQNAWIERIDILYPNVCRNVETMTFNNIQKWTMVRAFDIFIGYRTTFVYRLKKSRRRYNQVQTSILKLGSKKFMGFLDEECEIEYATQPMYLEIIKACPLDNSTLKQEDFYLNNNPMTNLESIEVHVESEEQQQQQQQQHDTSIIHDRSGGDQLNIFVGTDGDRDDTDSEE